MEKNKKISLGIMIGLVVVLLVSVIAVSKPKKTSGLPIVDDEQTTVENENDDVINAKALETIFDYAKQNENFDKTMEINDENYHIIFDKNLNTISVNNNEIIKDIGKIKYVYLLKDNFLVYTFKSETKQHGNINFFDINGNLINTIENVSNFRVSSDLSINYIIDTYIPREDEIYESHNVSKYSISYLGDNLYSEIKKSDYPAYTYTVNCDSEYFDSQLRLNNSCLIYDKNDLEIKLIEEHERHENSMYTTLQKYLIINENKISIPYVLSNIIKMNDGGLLVTANYQDGFYKKIFITDSSGIVKTNFDDYVDDNEMVTLVSFISEQNDKIFNGKEIIINSIDKDLSINYIDSYNACKNHNSSDILAKKWKFNYLGNGIVDNGYVIESITIGDYIKKTYNKNCEEIIKEIESKYNTN